MATKKSAAKSCKNMDALPAVAPEAQRSAERANMAMRPSVNAAAVMVSYGKPLGVEQRDIAALVNRLCEDVEDVWAGDMTRAEAMLFGQAHALQSMFMELARRAAAQEYLKHWEGYLRMALKAQNQCRMTLESLAAIKNPPVVIAKQANINNGGQQQVNNTPVPGINPSSAFAHASESETAPTKLLEPSDGERMDARAPRKTGSAHSDVEAVGAVLRPKKR